MIETFIAGFLTGACLGGWAATLVIQQLLIRRLNRYIERSVKKEQDQSAQPVCSNGMPAKKRRTQWD